MKWCGIEQDDGEMKETITHKRNGNGMKEMATEWTK